MSNNFLTECAVKSALSSFIANVKISNRRGVIETPLPMPINRLLDEKLSYYEEGYQHSTAFRLHRWDGKRHLYSLKRQSFPVGLLSYITEIFNENEIQHKLIDTREAAIPNSPAIWNKNIVLRDYQKLTVKDLIKARVGMAKLATGSGKTICIGGVVAYLNVPTLICVTTIDLLNQMVDNLTECMPEEAIGVIGGGICEIRKFTVSTMQSAVKALGEKYEAGDYYDVNDDTGIKNKIEISKFINEAKLVVYDECVTGDSLVLKEDGEIEEIKQISNGNKVLSNNLGNLESKIVSNLICRQAEIYRVRDVGGFTDCTNSHRWKVYDSITEEIVTKTTEELKFSTDYFLYPKLIPHITKTNETSQLVAHVIGLILCDGHLEKKTNTVKIEISKDIEYFEEVLNKFGLETGFVFKKRLTSQNTAVFWLCCKEFRNYMKKFTNLAGNKTPTIEIPKLILNSNLEIISSFIDACFCAEGDISCNSLNFNLTSLKFIRQLQLLLRKFGIVSGFGVYKVKNRTKSIVYRLRITGQNLLKFRDKIGLTMIRKQNALINESNKNKKNGEMYPINSYVSKLLKNKGLSIYNLAKSRRKDYLNLTPKKKHQNQINEQLLSDITELTQDRLLIELNKFYLKPLLEVENLNKVDWVYDFTVEDNHTFFVNGKLTSNCHHVTASSIQIISNQAKNAIWRMGVSATPFRERGDDLLIEGTIGRAIIDLNASYFIDRGLLVEPTIEYKYIYNSKEIQTGRWTDIYKNCIVLNKERNELIIKDALELSDSGRPTLVLIDEREEHGKYLFKRFKEEGARVEFLHGKVAKVKREKIIKDTKAGKIKILIATSLADEGMDIKCLSGLVLGGGKKSKIKTLQRIGRLLRPFDGKTDALVRDYIDDAEHLLEHSLARIRVLKSEPRFKIKAPNHLPDKIKLTLKRMKTIEQTS